MITDKPVVSDAMIAAGLADLRVRRLLKYLFASDPQSRGAYGYVDEPLDAETQREVVSAIYTAMHKASSPPEDVVERVATALANQIGARNGVPPIRNCLDIMPPHMAEIFRDDARAALKAMG